MLQQQLSREMNRSDRFVMTLKNKVSNRSSHKSDAAEEKREHGEIDGCYDCGADYGADGHARVGGHVLDAICGTSVRDGKALQRWVLMCLLTKIK